MPITNSAPSSLIKLLSVLFVLSIAPISLFATSLRWQVPVAGSGYLVSPSVSSVSQGPRLLTRNNSTRALALESVTLRSEPFRVSQLINFGAESRTRLLLFATNIDVATAANLSAFSADAEDVNHQVYPLEVEYVDRVLVSETTYAIHVRLSDQMTESGDVLVRLYCNGLPSNRVRVGLGNVGGGLPDDGGPEILQLSPSSVMAGASDSILSVIGSNFTAGSRLFLNGIEHSTTVASNNLLSSPLTSNDVALAGNYAVRVESSAGVSNSVSFTVNNPQPAIINLAPSSVIKGGSGFTLSVYGAGFVQGSIVNFNGSNRVTAFVSATLLTAQILASDVAGAGSFPVKVVNGAPGGGTSPAVSLVVAEPAPTPTPVPSPTPTPLPTPSATPSPTPVIGSQFHVAHTGTPSGDGSLQRPWDLLTALAHPASVKPGDVIWLRGGTYKGTFDSKLTGTAAAPIIVRAALGERVTIDLDTGNTGSTRAFNIDGGYTWFWGMEVTDSNPLRSTPTSGSHPPDMPRMTSSITVNGHHIKLINVITHDLGSGVRFWIRAVDSEIYGLVTYNNGWNAPDRGHGHGIYTQNNEGTKEIRDVISFNNFSSGMKAFGADGYANGYNFDGVISFNNGSPTAILSDDPDFREYNLLVGTAEQPSERIKITNSHLYYPVDNSSSNLHLGYYALDNQDITVQDNYIIRGQKVVYAKNWRSFVFTGNTLWLNSGPNSGPKLLTITPASTSVFSSYTIDRNSYYDTTPSQTGFKSFLWAGNVLQYLTYDLWKSVSGHDQNSTYVRSRPTGTKVILRPNHYERGRANIVVYNWAGGNTVTANLAATGLALGQQYEIKDVQNLFGPPVLTGTYNGQPIQLPLSNRTVTAPIGMSQVPAHTGPEFFVFVVLPK